MSTPKRKLLDLSCSTYLPDYHPTTQRKRIAMEYSQKDQEKYTKSNNQPNKYSVIQPQILLNRTKTFSNNFKLSLHTENQQIYQKYNDLYLNRQAKIKLKHQQKQIKDSIYKKKKQNLLKNSYFNLISLKQNQSISLKQNQTIREKNPFQSSKFVFEDFDSFRQK